MNNINIFQKLLATWGKIHIHIYILVAGKGIMLRKTLAEFISRIQIISTITPRIALAGKNQPKPKSSKIYKYALPLQKLISLKQLKTCLIVKFSHQRLKSS